MENEEAKATVEVKRGANESNSNILRRFSRKVNSSGILQLVRERRFRERAKSDNVRKKQTLRRLSRAAAFRRLYKEGKIFPAARGRFF